MSTLYGSDLGRVSNENQLKILWNQLTSKSQWKEWKIRPTYNEWMNLIKYFFMLNSITKWKKWISRTQMLNYSHQKRRLKTISHVVRGFMDFLHLVMMQKRVSLSQTVTLSHLARCRHWACYWFASRRARLVGWCHWECVGWLTDQTRLTQPWGLGLSFLSVPTSQQQYGLPLSQQISTCVSLGWEMTHSLKKIVYT